MINQKLWKKKRFYFEIKSANQNVAATRPTADERLKRLNDLVRNFQPEMALTSGGELEQGRFCVKVAPSRSFPRRNNMLCNVPLTFLLSSLFCFKRVSQKVWKGPQDYVIIAFIVFTFLHSKTHSKSHLLVFYSHPLLWFNFTQFIMKKSNHSPSKYLSKRKENSSSKKSIVLV